MIWQEKKQVSLRRKVKCHPVGFEFEWKVSPAGFIKNIISLFERANDMALNKKDKQGIVMILVFAVVIVMGGAYHFLAKNSKRVNRETLCLTKEKQRVIWAIFVDKTDPFTDRQSRYIKHKLERIKNRVGENEILSIYTINSEITRFTALEPIFSRCAPRTGEDANFLYEGEDYLKNNFNELFGKPLEDVVKKIETKEEHPSSPIIEGLAALGDIPEFSDGNILKRVLLISNGLQNVLAFSHYSKKPYSFAELKKTKYYQMINPSLGKNTEVEFVYLISPETEALQNEMHRKFWRDLLVDANAKKVEIHPVRRF